MTSVQLGAELGTGVVLVVTAGAQTVRHVRHTEAGISEGIRDMAQDGSELSLDGRVPGSTLPRSRKKLLSWFVRYVGA